MSWEVQTAVWKALRGNEALSAILGGRIYKAAPQDGDFPLIELGPDEDEYEGGDCLMVYRTRVSVLVWSLIEQGDGERGPHEAQKIARLVRDALHKRELPVEGCGDVELIWLSSRISRDDDGRAFYGVVTFAGHVEEIEETG